MEAGVEEVEAAEAQAAAEEALGVLEWAAEDLEAEAADPAPWGADRTWTAVEADRRRTAGYEKNTGMRRKGKPSTKTWKCLGNASRLASLPSSQLASQANKVIANRRVFPPRRALCFAVKHWWNVCLLCPFSNSSCLLQHFFPKKRPSKEGKQMS